MQFRKFPSIDQFRHVVADVKHKAEFIGLDAEGMPLYDPSRAKPVLTFDATVKLHGTNSGVALDVATGEMQVQSRERVLSIEDDNHGFCAWVKSERGLKEVGALMGCALSSPGLPASSQRSTLKEIRAFGEWCGPSVNAKTAIGKLPERWVIFGVLLTWENGQEHWLHVEPIAEAWARSGAADLLPGACPDGLKIHFITDYPRYTLSIDFNEPEAALGPLEKLTLEVEVSCPVAKAMGSDGIGEGLVWVCNDPVYGRHVFKTKGSKHKGTKNSRPVQVVPEAMASLDAFVNAVLTDSRLEQGFDLLAAQFGKVTQDHLGDFLQWVGRDVLKEESDTMQASGLEKKTVMPVLNRRAKAWLTPRLAKL